MGRSLGEIGKNCFFQEEDGRWNAIVLLKYRHGRRCRSTKGILVCHSDDGQDRKSLASRVEPPRLFFVFDFDLHFSFLVQELVLQGLEQVQVCKVQVQAQVLLQVQGPCKSMSCKVWVCKRV